MSSVPNVCVTGPLVGSVAGFWEALTEQGYTSLSATNQLRVLAHLSRWMVEEELDPSGLTAERVEAFLSARRAAGYTCWLSPRGVAPLLGFLRSVGVVPEPVAAVVHGPVERLLADYRRYLSVERGLVASTVDRYVSTARLFLDAQVDEDGRIELGALTAGRVVDFVQRECPARSVGTAKLLVSGVRSLLRFLHVEGLIEHRLDGVVPSVAGWRDAGLPRWVDPSDVQRLLDACDRDTAIGVRDFAVLLLLARLGLRAHEVAGLSLDDVGWRIGELVVAGKGGTVERLPLPIDVGEALVGWLRQGRPQVGHRVLFVALRAPYGPATPALVQASVRAACRRAKIVEVGAHRLRHTAATRMIRAGASLAEIAQVLRHRDVTTTALYAKVDVETLRQLATPWPGGGA